MGNQEAQIGWIIRQAEQADLDQVFNMAKALATSFEPEYSTFARSFAEVGKDESAWLGVADRNGELIGYCLGFDHIAFYANGRVAWVEELFVSSEWRAAGVGRALMAAFEQWSTSRNARLVALATRRAAVFYRAIGYEESATYFRKVLS